jgi:hypothetical protein
MVNDEVKKEIHALEDKREVIEKKMQIAYEKLDKLKSDIATLDQKLKPLYKKLYK